MKNLCTARRHGKEIKEGKGISKNWYRTGENEAVLFVTATPDSELKELLQKDIAKSKSKIKLVEKSGKEIVRHLQRNNPFA